MLSNPIELLRARGIQVTAQRLAVLRAVATEPHVRAERVAELVRDDIGAISLQSVYDALTLLATGGLIRRIQPAGSPARFEDRVGDNHHHLICRGCGRIVDIACAVGRAPCLTAAHDHGYEIDEAEVAYWGRCPDCVKRAGGDRRAAAPRGSTDRVRPPTPSAARRGNAPSGHRRKRRQY